MVRMVEKSREGETGIGALSRTGKMLVFSTSSGSVESLFWFTRAARAAVFELRGALRDGVSSGCSGREGPDSSGEFESIGLAPSTGILRHEKKEGIGLSLDSSASLEEECPFVGVANFGDLPLREGVPLEGPAEVLESISRPKAREEQQVTGSWEEFERPTD
jgi:hypothetical protein